MRPWSISTTIRNPSRLGELVATLAELEGVSFDEAAQERFQILLIQCRHYRPMDMTEEEKAIYDNPDREFTYAAAERIFRRQGYVDPAMRGRQSANPLNKLGFAVARETGGPVRITRLGKALIDGSLTLESALLSSLSRLQLPNPAERRSTADNGFNVRPLIATLQFLTRAEARFGQGITATEFALFIPTLCNADDIARHLDALEEYRSAPDKRAYFEQFAQTFYGHVPSETELNNLHEYADNTMRYFRLTRLFRVTKSSFGAEWRIGIEPLRAAEVASILSTESVTAGEFADVDEYIDYLNADVPLGADTSVVQEVRSHIAGKQASAPADYAERIATYLAVDSAHLADVHAYIEEGRTLLAELLRKEHEASLRGDTIRLREIIAQLSDTTVFRTLEPEEFEYVVAQALQIIHADGRVVPHYLTDDQGMPIGHAPGNQADIDAFYPSFAMIAEVTKATGSTQWIMETAPVMRHLSEFAAHHTPAYCLFVAPRLHTDTGHHFLFANTQGYNGVPMRIAPFTLSQFVKILTTYATALEAGRTPGSEALRNLLDAVIAPAQGQQAWFTAIDSIVDSWTLT